MRGPDPHRLVLVTSRVGGGYGVVTGYLVSERLVLTTGHRLGCEIIVRRFDPAAQVSSAVVRWRPGGTDVAVLETEETFDLASRAPVRWGTLRGDEQQDWAGMGFPAARVETTPGGRRQRQPVPLAGLAVVGRDGLELTVEADPGEAGLWQGISGAPVMVDGALAGIVQAVPEAFEGRRLVATPVIRIVEMPDARRWLDPAGLPQELPAVPSGPLRTGIRTLHNKKTPSALLLSHHCVVGFDRDLRNRELERLAKWLDDPEPQSVALVTGPGGSGKTRLLIELCRERRRQGWRAGFFPASQPLSPDAMDRLLSGSDPVLVVVDYAARRPGLTEELGELLSRHAEDSGPRLRVLLADRAEGDWWPELSSVLLEHGRPVLETSVHLSPVSAEGDTRRRLFENAVEAFTTKVERAAPVGARVELEDRRFERPLFIHAAALLTVLGEKVRPETILDALLRREAGGWLPQGENDSSRRRVLQRRARRAVAALTLTGGASNGTAAINRIKAAMDEADVPRAELEELCDRLRQVYPAQGSTGIGPLEPGLLGQHLVFTVLEELEKKGGRASGFLHRVLDGLDEGDLQSAFTTLGAVAADHPERIVGPWLDTALAAHLPERAFPAARAAGTLGRRIQAGPLDRALARAVRRDGDAEAAERLDDMIPPRKTLSLRATAVAALQVLLARLPETEASQPERARLLNNLGGRLSELGRLEEALNATFEAVRIRRQLAKEHPDAFLPDLAGSLSNLGVDLSELGRLEEALDAASEAVEIHRQLAKDRPGAFLPGLAGSLSKLGAALSKLGRLEEALDAASEAVQIHRQLAKKHRDAFLPDLAGSLNNLGGFLSRLGRLEEALDAASEAVQIRRQLAKKNPDAFLPDLAGSLGNLGVLLSGLGRYEDTVEVAREALEIFTALAERWPEVFGGKLRVATRNLERALQDVVDQPDAVQALNRALDLLERIGAA